MARYSFPHAGSRHGHDYVSELGPSGVVTAEAHRAFLWALVELELYPEETVINRGETRNKWGHEESLAIVYIEDYYG